MSQTKRELELEMALWQEKRTHLQTSINLLNAQGQLLQAAQREIADNLARLDAALKEEANNAAQETPSAPPEAPPA